MFNVKTRASLRVPLQGSLKGTIRVSRKICSIGARIEIDMVWGVYSTNKQEGALGNSIGTYSGTLLVDTLYTLSISQQSRRDCWVTGNCPQGPRYFPKS